MSQRQVEHPVISPDSQRSLLPPPPPPPPPPLPEFSNQSSLPAKRLYQVLAEGQLQQRSDREEVKRLLQNRSDSFSKELNWLLINAPIPSMIQDGPQCGLVALWMAGHLLNAAQPVSLEEIVSCAVEKNYTAQGEMFSGDNMVKLAKEVFACHGDLLSGGLLGSNKTRILSHLEAGYPALIPYPCKLLTSAQTAAAAHYRLARCRLNCRDYGKDEDFNHEPCLRRGHRAHWAVVSGVLLGLRCELLEDIYEKDPDIPSLYYPNGGVSGASYSEDCVVESHLLAKQGKSLKYQLWEYELVHRSNMQLTEFSPKRDNDGTSYVIPQGGVKLGLCGVVILLQPLLSQS